MWDYDRLFANENIVGISYPDGEIVPFPVKFQKESNRENLIKYYGNEDLSHDKHKIQYIIRLDEHGNVVEKMFDRDEDIPKPMPELKTGMFVSVAYGRDYNVHLGYVNTNNNQLVYQDGGWDFIDKDFIIEVYSSNANCFKDCTTKNLLWRSPDYKTYLDLKSN